MPKKTVGKARGAVENDVRTELKGSFDADVIRLTREVSEYAAATREAEERLWEEG